LKDHRSNKPAPGMTGNWGILGGAFDPVHRGHLTLASDIRAAKTLTGVLFVPSYEPPHKMNRCEASWDDRLAMIRLAIEGRDSFKVSTVEAEMSQPGYSLNTVRALKCLYPDVTWYFIIGEDLLSEFAAWHRPEEILREVRILAGSRPAAPAPGSAQPYRSDRIEVVTTGLFDVSSTEIRRRIKEGTAPAELRELVGDAVGEYILSRKLYR